MPTTSTKKFGNFEQRYLPRWQVSNRVLCKPDTDSLSRECRSKDINCAGASIYSDESMIPDQKVKLTIYLDQDVLVRVQGKVLWSREEDSQHLIGITFNQTSKRAQDLILKHAFEINKDQLRNHWFEGWGNKP